MPDPCARPVALPAHLVPLLAGDPDPPAGVLAHQHATIWMGRLVEVEVHAADGSLAEGETKTWQDGAVLRHVRCARFARAALPRARGDRYPLFLAAALLLGAPVGLRAASEAPRPPATVEGDGYVGRIAFSAAGLPDVNPEAGRGRSQAGDPGEAGDVGDAKEARGAARAQGREGVDGTPGLSGGDGPRLEQGSGRVEEIAAGLTSVDGGEATASGLEGERQRGALGQLTVGEGQGAEGQLPSLAGLARTASWIDNGRGLRGPGGGPGADRRGIDDGVDGAAYLSARPRGFVATEDDPTSHFSLDVDRASYARARGALQRGKAIAPEEVRPEEFVNAMPMGIEGGSELAWDVALARVDDTEVLRVTVRLADEVQRAPLDLVIVVDDSGSMTGESKILQARDAAHGFVDALRPEDRVRLITFGDLSVATGEASVRRRLDQLSARGSSPLGAALIEAAELASSPCEGCRPAVLVLADGGSNWSDLGRVVYSEVSPDIAVGLIGFGQGGFAAETLEEVAMMSGGTWHFVDRADEAARLARDLDQVLGTQEAPTLHVEFGAGVESWRLVGYGNRQLAEGASDTEALATVQAGRVGGGQVVTALYELDTNGAGPIARIELRQGADRQALADVRASDRADLDPATQVAWGAAGLGEALAASPFAPTDLDALASSVQAASFAPEHDELALLLRQVR